MSDDKTIYLEVGILDYKARLDILDGEDVRKDLARVLYTMLGELLKKLNEEGFTTKAKAK